MTLEQVADTLNAATQSLETVNQNMNAFMLTMVAVVVVGALLIMFVFIRTTDKISDRTASTQKQDNDIQVKTIDLAAKVFGSIDRLTAAVEGDGRSRAELKTAIEEQVSTMKLFVKESRDQNNALSETVGELSTRVGDTEDAVKNVGQRMEALETAVRDLCSDEAAVQRFTEKIESAKNEILAAILRKSTTEATT